MLKLIPINERGKHTCVVCGTAKSAKYMVDLYGEEDQIINTVPMCNMCALALSLTRAQEHKANV